MNLLAIETSCDETAAAVIAETGDAGRPWRDPLERRRVAGGDPSRVGRRRARARVAPARARHLRRRRGGARRRRASTLDDIGAVAVTQGPGLVGSLLVGVAFAQGARLVARHPGRAGSPSRRAHRVAHARARRAAAAGRGAGRVGRAHQPVSRSASRGHYQLIGRTRDDAAGEAYDKVAKLLGLGYPGGPAIDRVARAAATIAPSTFPSTRLTHADRNAPKSTGDGMLPADIARRIDFSFSGLKTAVLRLVRERTGA